MASEESATVNQQVIGHLVALVAVVGGPSAGRLERVSKSRHRSGRAQRSVALAHASVDDILKCKRRKLPKWPFVRELLVTCREIATEDRLPLDVSALGSDDEWWALLNRAQREGVVDPSPIRFAELGVPIVRVEPERMPVVSAEDARAQLGPEIAANTSPDVPLGPLARGRDQLRRMAGERHGRAAHKASKISTQRPGDDQLAGLTTVIVPELNEGGSWVSAVEWHVEEGSSIESGELIVDIVNEMGLLFQLPAPIAGVVETIFAKGNELMPANQPLCTIRQRS